MSTFIGRFALVGVVLALVFLAITGSLLSSSPRVIAAQVCAVGLALWARRSFPSETFRVTAAPAAQGVIRRGPYRLIRHPMYAAALLFVWAAVLSHSSLPTVVVGILVTILVSARIVLEERMVAERYPEYAAYARSTKAVVPYLL